MSISGIFKVKVRCTDVFSLVIKNHFIYPMSRQIECLNTKDCFVMICTDYNSVRNMYMYKIYDDNYCI